MVDVHICWRVSKNDENGHVHRPKKFFCQKMKHLFLLVDIFWHLVFFFFHVKLVFPLFVVQMSNDEDIDGEYEEVPRRDDLSGSKISIYGEDEPFVTGAGEAVPHLLIAHQIKWQGWARTVCAGERLMYEEPKVNSEVVTFHGILVMLFLLMMNI